MLFPGRGGENCIQAVDAFFVSTHEKYKEYFKNDFGKTIQKKIDEYIKEHATELSDLFSKEGAKALTIEVLNNVMPTVCKIISDEVLGSSPKEEVCLIKVKDIEGKWLVTQAKIAEEKKDTEEQDDESEGR